MRKIAYQTLFIVKLLLVAINPQLTHAQQRVNFSQYMCSGILINPAYAGVDQALSMTFFSRNQWTGLDGAPSTESLAAHTLLKNQNVGLGFSILQDKIGVHHNYEAQLAGAYHLRVGAESYLSFGLQGSFNHKESDYFAIANPSTNDPRIPPVQLARNVFNMGAGFFFRAKKFQAGLSSPQLIAEEIALNDSITLSFARKQYFLFSKYSFYISDQLDFIPSMLVKYHPALPVSIDINAGVLLYKIFFAGISYRKSESVDFLLRASVTPQLQIGYGYDYPFGHAALLGNASHELMVSYLFKFARHNIASPR